MVEQPEIPTELRRQFDEWGAAGGSAPKNLRGACGGCGFLGKRRIDGPGAATVDEASEFDRAGAELWRSPTNGYAEPFCYLWVTSLINEIGGDNLAKDKRSLALRRVILRDRKCPKWFPYTPGFSPKEHLQRLEVFQLEQRDRALAQDLANVQKDALDRSADYQRNQIMITEKLASIADKTDRFTTRWTRIAVALTFAALVVVLATYFFPDAGRHIIEWIHFWLTGTR